MVLNAKINSELGNQMQHEHHRQQINIFPVDYGGINLR